MFPSYTRTIQQAISPNETRLVEVEYLGEDSTGGYTLSIYHSNTGSPLSYSAPFLPPSVVQPQQPSAVPTAVPTAATPTNSVTAPINLLQSHSEPEPQLQPYQNYTITLSGQKPYRSFILFAVETSLLEMKYWNRMLDNEVFGYGLRGWALRGHDHQLLSCSAKDSSATAVTSTPQRSIDPRLNDEFTFSAPLLAEKNQTDVVKVTFLAVVLIDGQEWFGRLKPIFTTVFLNTTAPLIQVETNNNSTENDEDIVVETTQNNAFKSSLKQSIIGVLLVSALSTLFA